MKFANKKRGLLKYTILVQNNITKKHKSVRVDNEEVKNEEEFLNLIKKLLKNHYKEETN
jgi:hypothetical protein